MVLCLGLWHATFAADLTRADADIWLDGFMPYAINSGDISGAAVVIVKDGKVITERGYGYADVGTKRPVDPRTTLFRVGSVSKLFTWTAVMQQVELGKINLDHDVNEYLDFKIPPYDGKPITMRMIMTHTAGFEDAFGGLLVTGNNVPSIADVVRRWIPKRIYAPGTTPAYSNYAPTLAGYIVERVSGEPFDGYVEHHILQPLRMDHSTFREPLPLSLAAYVSKGYSRASEPSQAFEMVTVRPAGAGSMTPDDLSRFMLAHLDEEHNVLLKPETMRMMHGSGLTLMAPLNGMKLGFAESNLNGVGIIGHGGDTQWFHCYLWLMPAQHVGVFVGLNSLGRDGAAYSIRDGFTGEFVRRYFATVSREGDVAVPAASGGGGAKGFAAAGGVGRADVAGALAVSKPVERPGDATATVADDGSVPGFRPRAADARAVAGTYLASRHSESGIRRALNFFTQVTVTADASGGVHADAFTFQGINNAPRTWVEIAPFLWKDANSSERLTAQLRDGKVVRFAVDSSAAIGVFNRVPWYASTAWLRRAGKASVALLVGWILSVPFEWIVRRYYGAARWYHGVERAAYLASTSLALAAIVILILWLRVLMSLTFEPLGKGVYVLEVATIVALPALCLACVWFWLTGLRAKRGVAGGVLRLGPILASACILWIAIAFNLTHIGLNY